MRIKPTVVASNATKFIKPYISYFSGKSKAIPESYGKKPTKKVLRVWEFLQLFSDYYPTVNKAMVAWLEKPVSNKASATFEQRLTSALEKDRISSKVNNFELADKLRKFGLYRQFYASQKVSQIDLTLILQTLIYIPRKGGPRRSYPSKTNQPTTKKDEEFRTYKKASHKANAKSKKTCKATPTLPEREVKIKRGPGSGYKRYTPLAPTPPHEPKTSKAKPPIPKMDAVANEAATTLGPKDNNVIVDRKFGSPTITHEGVSVAKEIEHDDPFVNMNERGYGFLENKKDAIFIGAVAAGDATGAGNAILMDDNSQTSPETSKYQSRVLNVGFSKKDNGVMVNPEQAFVSEKPYYLMVDIGPYWVQLPSLVVKSENAVFPEEHLPKNQKGYRVRAAFVSEDFTPHMTSAEMWVPAKGGRSFPIIDGVRSEEAKPALLVVRTPHLDNGQREARAYGRLCLYYQGQLLQSARVSVGIANHENAPLDDPNKIEVDYVLTSDLKDMAKQLGKRRAQFRSGGKRRPISVGLTLNDDGSGRHRILATYHLDTKQEETVPPAWGPYDPQSAQKQLDKFRKVIASCYDGLNKTFGKKLKNFQWDMLELAKVGDGLRTLALSDLDVSDTGRTVALWRQELMKAMKTATVIQIARTGPANYVFPWALVYDYPMPGPDNKFQMCKVITEWNDQGIRTKLPDYSCPHKDEPWHQENIVCPYGFWGLKHIIEQPPGAIHKQNGQWNFNLSDKVIVHRDCILGIGVTYDIAQSKREQHISRLSPPMQAHLNPLTPANNRASVLEMLHSPEIVYFLCHGETDANQTPYLSIGEHINDISHQIFPNTLEQWSDKLDLQAWQTTRPLIFINGCHTAELQPGIVLNFVSAFTDLGASGVIGTEVSVLADMAMYIGELVLGSIADGMEIGQAIRNMRWDLVNRGNLLGLAYTPYSLANLHLQRSL